MIQFNLSTKLSSVLDVTASVQADDQPVMTWFAHSVEIDGSLCIISVEQQTCYAMVFCGLSDDDCEKFPELFRDRLWREVYAICQEGNGEIIHHLCQNMIELCGQQSYQVVHDRSIQSLMGLIVADLETRIFDSGLALPVDCEEAFEFGVEVNHALRHAPDQRFQYFTPIESFKRFCLGQLSNVVPLSLFAENSVSAMARYLGKGKIGANELNNKNALEQSHYELCNNVIEVDFFARKKKYQFDSAIKSLD